MKIISKLSMFIILFLKMLSVVVTAEAQQYESFLYGSVITKDNTVYTGAIRWGDEEVFLTDLFNAKKIENPYIKYIDKLPDSENSLQYSSYNRRFLCRFGDIASITPTGSMSAIVELKNEKFINVRRYFNDIGTKVAIIDKELGLLDISWYKIKEVRFFTPEKYPVESFGNPIYGKVTTTVGEFTGFIQWDKDERLLSDKLDGDSKEVALSIPFHKIKNIRKIRYGSEVTLKSGRKVELKNSNDVTSANRGIIVTMPQVGRVTLDWKHFLSLELFAYPKALNNCNNQFPPTERLSGTIYTTGNEKLEGVIIYDLDEAMNAEILDGLNDYLDFEIPFRNIKKIEPKSYNYCLVELKKGDKLYLGEESDVSDKGYGFLIFTGGEKYRYLQWKDIKKIVFD